MESEYLNKILEYKAGRLYWRKRTGTRGMGNMAGTKRNDGYRHVRIDGKYYQEHIVIWCMVKGEWPTSIIDHKNEIRDDNSIDNLRLASKCQNAYNTGKWKCNTSGYKGVSLNKKSGKWVAYISLNRQNIHLGSFESLSLAVAAHKKATIDLHGEFANTRTLCASSPSSTRIPVPATTALSCRLC